ncbi:MAG: hypothetical protein KAT15_21585, partial [Bacteroidales bacterium]|nr:hypothetical protein [Bacteroidales bacterium]
MNEKSHIQFDALTSFENMKRDLSDNWIHVYSSYAYIQLKDGASPDDLQAAFEEISLERYEGDPEHYYSFQLQALSNICPGPLLANELGFYLPRMVIYFMVVLAFILIITSAFNYTNMSLAKALTRAREIGVRKVAGAHRIQIFSQFLYESILSAVIALLLAWFFLQFLLPAFEGMKFMSMLEISPKENFLVYLWFLGFALVTGTIAGLLPAIYMSTFNPIAVFKDTFGIRVLSRMFLRKFLIVTQFAVSIILFITIVLLFRQLRFFMNTDYGFRKENILNVELQGNPQERVRSAFEAFPEISNITWSSHIPAMGSMRSKEAWIDNKEDKFDLAYFSVDGNYIDVLDLKLLYGRSLPLLPDPGDEKYLIMNETAVESFGFSDPQASLGQIITISDTILLEVIGVVKDYHFFGMFSKIGPMALRQIPKNYRYAHLLRSTGDIIKTMSKIEKAWEEIDPDRELKSQFM